MKLSNNLTIEQLLKTPFGYQFTQEQKSLILQAVEIGVEPAEIAKPAFDSNQMHTIMYGLQNDVDATLYAFVDYHNFMMQVIYHLLANGARFDKYVVDDHLDVDKIMRDYDLLIRYKGFSRLSKHTIDTIYDSAPYYVKQ